MSVNVPRLNQSVHRARSIQTYLNTFIHSIETRTCFSISGGTATSTSLALPEDEEPRRGTSRGPLPWSSVCVWVHLRFGGECWRFRGPD